MNEDNLEHWIDRAQIMEAMPKEVAGLRVLKNNLPPKTRGATIMEIADKVLPVLQRFFNGKRDDEGMLLQPAHIRGIALNYAENLLKAKEQDDQAVA